MQVVFGGIQQLYEQIGRVVSSPGSLMPKQDRGYKLLGATEAWKQVFELQLDLVFDVVNPTGHIKSMFIPQLTPSLQRTALQQIFVPGCA